MQSTRVAVVQAGSVFGDTERTLEKLERLTEEVRGRGAALVLFPEAFVGGYPKGLDFGARVGMRSGEGREMFRRYYEGAVDVPGPAVERIGRAAGRASLHLVVGVIERDRGTLYCTVLFFGPGGEFLGKHRKLMPTATERVVWGFGDGSTMPVFETALGRLGAVICWENYMPLLRTAMYARGIELYCAPTADDRETWLPTMRHIALEGRCFVLTACQFLRRSDCPTEYECVQGHAPETVRMRGGSCIISPFGQVLAGPQFGGECLLTADLDATEIIRGKFDLDVVGHYARPDVFRLVVDERPQRPVSSEGPPTGRVDSSGNASA